MTSHNRPGVRFSNALSILPPDVQARTPTSSNHLGLPPRIPAPRYRHAAPSGPWPWMDFNADISAMTPEVEGPPPDPVNPWKGYPQSLFGNWTPEQVKRSKMFSNLSHKDPDATCSVYNVDVLKGGKFAGVESYNVNVGQDEERFWKVVQEERPSDVRVRALFVEDMSPPVLKMLGTKFVIEPFFFTSSANWIPSRYQEGVDTGQGDHITITLPFIRAMHNPMTVPPSPTSEPDDNAPARALASKMVSVYDEQQVIDTQASLTLRSTDDILLLDLLALHMVRTPGSSTIISYHPGHKWQRVSAKRLHMLFYKAGQSVYWRKIFEKTDDPTFMLLAILWYAVYAWDEAFEILYRHVNWLESRVLTTNDIHLTRELHVIQAHLLHYTSLLSDFSKSVNFVRKTEHPGLAKICPDEDKLKLSRELLEKECNNLLSEIERLEGRRAMQSSRLKNVMELAFATVNIEDSKDMRRLTEATVRDSAAMKQISYLTMIFLPANFTATVFGMNVVEINDGSHESLRNYIIATVILTTMTMWLIVAFQQFSPFHEEGDPLYRRILWPGLYLRRRYQRRREQQRVMNNLATSAKGMQDLEKLDALHIETIEMPSLR